jgi:invasion protein IalB
MRLATTEFYARIAGIASLCLLASGSLGLAQTLQPKATKPPAAGAPTQPAPEAVPQTPTWMVNCTSVAGGFDCRASQTLFIKSSNTRVLTLVVRTTPGAKRPVMLIQGPLGIYLPAGITLQVGKAAAKALPVQNCDQGGCLTEYAITDEEIEAIRGGADLTVTMQDLKKTPVPLKVPSLGFAEAYAKLQ